MLEETGDEDATEFGVIESPADGAGGGLGVERVGWSAWCRHCSVVTFTGEPHETMEHSSEKFVSCSWSCACALGTDSKSGRDWRNV